MVSALVIAQIDKITRVPGITEYIPKETVFEKFSIPMLMFVKYNDIIIIKMLTNEYAQIERNFFLLSRFKTNKISFLMTLL